MIDDAWFARAAELDRESRALVATVDASLAVAVERHAEALKSLHAVEREQLTQHLKGAAHGRK